MPAGKIKNVDLAGAEPSGGVLGDHPLAPVPAGANLAVVHLGDHWDLPSLSSYDKGKRCMEGRRVKTDIVAGNKALKAITVSTKTWGPENYLLKGNHENRAELLGELDPQLNGGTDGRAVFESLIESLG